MSTFAIGVDLGGTNLRIAAVDERGTLLEKTTLGTQVVRGRDFVIHDMTEAIRATASKFSQTKLVGIGIGVPGIIDMATGILRESPNLPGWHDYPVRDEIERRLQTKVVLENDANAAALGEKWLGAAREHGDMLMLTVGTGVGGGMVLGGRVWHGTRGMAGEPGHITIQPNGEPCPCGNRGCLEQYASATAIVRMAREAIAAGNSPVLKRAAENPEFGAKLIYQMGVEGDRDAQEIFRRVGWALGIGLADLINLLNLPIYVIGGGAAGAWDAFLPALLEEVRKRSFVYRATGPESASAGQKTIITKALLGSDAGLFGAARLPMLAAETVTQEVARKRA
jgi:glucokinase